MSTQIGHQTRGECHSDPQRSFGPILAGPSISSRSDHVPVTFCHVPNIGFTFGFRGMRSHIIVYVPSRSHYVLSRSVRDVCKCLCFFYTFLHVPGNPIGKYEQVEQNSPEFSLGAIAFFHVPPCFPQLTLVVSLRSFTFPLRSFTFRSRGIQLVMFFLYVPLRSRQQYRKYAA